MDYLLSGRTAVRALGLSADAVRTITDEQEIALISKLKILKDADVV
jgi:hypothetical protein